MTAHLFDLPDVDDWVQELDLPAIDRLSEIHAPTLFVVGDQDVADILKIGDSITSTVPEAKKVIIPGTAHHLNLEKPAEFNRVVLEFLQPYAFA